MFIHFFSFQEIRTFHSLAKVVGIINGFSLVVANGFNSICSLRSVVANHSWTIPG